CHIWLQFVGWLLRRRSGRVLRLRPSVIGWRRIRPRRRLARRRCSIADGFNGDCILVGSTTGSHHRPRRLLHHFGCSGHGWINERRIADFRCLLSIWTLGEVSITCFYIGGSRRLSSSLLLSPISCFVGR